MVRGQQVSEAVDRADGIGASAKVAMKCGWKETGNTEDQISML